jgi:hypothetical protein
MCLRITIIRETLIKFKSLKNIVIDLNYIICLLLYYILALQAIRFRIDKLFDFMRRLNEIKIMWILQKSVAHRFISFFFIHRRKDYFRFIITLE